jgi:hypothetical protein
MRPGAFWGPSNLKRYGCKQRFVPGKAEEDVKLTTALHLVPNLRMSAAIEE